jgi:peptidoglycan/LPS O-acetylase OafA/YrhL
VVAFHLANGVAPGGFVGVDVFFVISGYLMTNIIVGGLERGDFRVSAFYVARFRRIAPALVALGACLWLVGATLLDPWTFEDLAKKLPWALLFVSNIALTRGGGYFAPDETTDWLLHTWSLSVEWQFYMLYPLLLAGLYASKSGRRRLWPVIGLVFAGSLGLALAVAGGYRSWAFYLLPTRAWELLAGAFCAAIEPKLRLARGSRWAGHLAGLAAIALGVWLARPGVGWPSAVTLLPVGGAVLVIIAGLERSYWAEAAPVRWLGLGSYSIYLWHWPLLVGLRGASVPLTPLVSIAAVAAMVVLGLASYLVVERWATERLFRPRPRWRLMAGVTASVLALSLVATATHGLEPLRTIAATSATKAALADARAAERDWAFPKVCDVVTKQATLSRCELGDPAARQVLVIGDSQAEQLAARYAHAFGAKSGRGLTFLTEGGCIPIPGVSLYGRSEHCGRTWTDAYRWAETAGFGRVVIASAWPLYFDPAPGRPLGITCLQQVGGCEAGGRFSSVPALADAEFDRLADEIRRLQNSGAQVVLIGTTPSTADTPRALYRNLFWTGQLAPAALSRAAYEQRASLARAELRRLSRATGAPLVDPLNALCPQDQCASVSGGRAIYKDYGHFRASRMKEPRFAYLDPWLTPADPLSRLK